MNVKPKYTTVLELSKKFGLKKPSLTYYVQLGLLVPDFYVGKTAVFVEEEVLKTWKKIKELRKNNTLPQIREIFAKENVNRKR